MEKQKKTYKREIIKGIPDGTTLVLPYDPDTFRSWQQRVVQINKEEGWHHYGFAYSRPLGRMEITAHEPEYAQAEPVYEYED